MTDQITEYVEGKSSGYVVRVERIQSTEDSAALSRAGYRSEFTLFMVFGGSQVHASHDRHKLVRRMTGDNHWLHEHFRRLESELIEAQPPSGGSQR